MIVALAETLVKHLCLPFIGLCITLQKWRRRWFVLGRCMETDRPILHYYTDKKNAGRKKPRGEIELEHCEQVRTNNSRRVLSFVCSVENR